MAELVMDRFNSQSASSFDIDSYVNEGRCDFLTRFVRSTMPDALKRFLGASDIVQSVLMRARRKQHLFTGQSDYEYRLWLRTIAHRRIADALRRFQIESKSLAQAHQLADQRDHDKQNALEPISGILMQEQAELLIESMASLPEEIQQIVSRRYAMDMTFEQIAEALGIPSTTCRRRWREGCQILRKRLSGLVD